MGLQLPPKDQDKLDALIASETAAASKDRMDILRSIHRSAWNPLEVNDAKKISTTVSRFATLLVSLSIQADRIQRWMVILTVAISVMTLVLLVLTGIMAYKMFFP